MYNGERPKGYHVRLKQKTFELAPLEDWSFSHRVLRAFESDPKYFIKKYIGLLGAVKNLASQLRLPDHLKLDYDTMGAVHRNNKILNPESILTGGRKYLVFIKPGSDYYEEFLSFVNEVLPEYYQPDDKPTFRIAIKGTGAKDDITSLYSLSNNNQVLGFTKNIKEEIIDAHLFEKYGAEYLPGRIRLFSIPIDTMKIDGVKMNLKRNDPNYPLITGDQQANVEVYLELGGSDLLESANSDALEEQVINRIIHDLRFHPKYRNCIAQFENRETSLVEFFNNYCDILLENLLENLTRFLDIDIANRIQQNINIAGDFQDFEDFEIRRKRYPSLSSLDLFPYIAHIANFIDPYNYSTRESYTPRTSKAKLLYNLFINTFTIIQDSDFKKELLTTEFASTIFEIYLKKPTALNTATLSGIYKYSSDDTKKHIQGYVLHVASTYTEMLKKKTPPNSLLYNSWVIRIFDFIATFNVELGLKPNDDFANKYISSMLSMFEGLIRAEKFEPDQIYLVLSTIRRFGGFSYLPEYKALKKSLLTAYNHYIES